MNFVADFHIHSRFSRATSKTLDFKKLHIAAQLKGVSVVGTGDFTHPGWLAEIKEKLIPDEKGLFKLKPDIESICNQQVPSACRSDVRFILVTEISNIYKKRDKTRKNHNLVFVPDLEIAEKFNTNLASIGNIKSDGRPLLGLDARDLLEIVLETSDQAFLIPAHIWTPWFSLLGSKSGFDSVEECFEDLTSHIFAVETGLSSDPAMNWRVSSLDGLTLVSNSDAHSPFNLGREANLFNIPLSYPSIKHALETGNPDQFLGTTEFYPEEGKYHFDGHRKCGVCYNPEESITQKGICPVCEKPLTLGVLYRVENLADRPHGVKPEKYHPYANLIPLNEILSELLNVGPKSKTVNQHYETLLKALGSELKILRTAPIDDINRVNIPLLGEAINRMRQGKVKMSPGYDGEYGKITLFDPDEKKKLLGQQPLFQIKPRKERNRKPPPKKPFKKTPKDSSPLKGVSQRPISLNSEQLRAVEHTGGPLLVVAGPGTGKTRTLTHRIAYLLTKKGISEENILAVTFTNKAAHEMMDRLSLLLGDSVKHPFVGTFHSFCYSAIKEMDQDKTSSIIDDELRKTIVQTAKILTIGGGSTASVSIRALLDGIVAAKQRFISPKDPPESFPDNYQHLDFIRVYSKYQELLSIEGLYDYEDLIYQLTERFNKKPDLLDRFQNRYQYIFVDEYQDLNYGQYQLIRALSPPGNDLFVIGDPEQSIYGFRGSDVKYFQNFIDDYPDAAVIHLKHNYRSTQTILDASFQVIKGHSSDDTSDRKSRVFSQIDGSRQITIMEIASEKAEAVAVGRTIERLVGGMGFHSVDFGNIDSTKQEGHRSFSDIAIFYRTGAQAEVFSDAFDKAGIPYQMASKEKLVLMDGIKELISLIKLMEGFGSYMDLEIVVKALPYSIGKNTIDIFKLWGYNNKFRIKDALWHAKRIPVPNMSKKGQKQLYEFVSWLDGTEETAASWNLENRLRYLAENTNIRSTIGDNRLSKTAYDRILSIASAFGNRIEDFMVAIALQTDTDVYDSKSEKVSLMTIHAAKGLEFPVVFVTGCEDGYIPYHHKDSDSEEERRLFYVAMTRAMDHLYFTYTRKRRVHGKQVQRRISPFVKEIEEQLRDHQALRGKNPKPNEHKQLKLF
jgi:uncharacterized protein (TIGR00375 family)